MTVSAAVAQSTWNSTSSNDWTVTANWSPSQADYPGSGTLVGTGVIFDTVLPPGSPASVTLSGSTDINSLTFASGVTTNIAFNSDGSPGTEILLETGGITNNTNGSGSISSPTFNLQVTMGGSSAFTGGTGALIFNSILNVGVNTLTTSGAVNITNNGQLILGIGDDATIGTYGNITGNSVNISTGGVVTISILGAYQGNFGDVFSFNTAGFTNATLDTLPTLGSGLQWDSTDFITQGMLTVVPEPSPITLLGLAGFAFCFLLRRKAALKSVGALALCGIGLGLLPTTGYSQGATTLEIVNDSGIPDAQLYFRVVGYPTNGLTTMTPTTYFTTIGEANPANATMVPLNSMATTNYLAPYSSVSTSSGNTNTVYSIQINSIASGQIYFQYGGTPFVFTNGTTPGAGPFGSNAFRYDYAEFTIFSTNGGNNAMDVTYVDKFGFPIRQEWFRGSQLMNSGSTHLSTKDMVQQFQALGLNPAVYGVNTNGLISNWQYVNANSYTNFARIVAPQDMFPASTPYAFPYPSVSRYLSALASGPITYKLNGNSPHGGYTYQDYTVSLSTTSTGWLVTMAPGANSLNTWGNNTAYTNTITIPISAEGATQWVAKSSSADTYLVNGAAPVDAATTALELWMMGDVQTALNTGFWGGSSSDSLNWYLQQAVVPTPTPFGGASGANLGYYNAFSAILYNFTDFYGYTYGERFTPNVLYNPMPGDRLRITILPDDRLNSPVVAVPTGGNVGSNSITLNWPAIPGATGYQISTIAPAGIPQTNISTTNYTASNLTPGWPYTFLVQATATAGNGNPLVSDGRPVSVKTLGPIPTTSVTGNLSMIQLAISMSDPFHQISKVTFNGVDYLGSNNFQTNGIPPRWVVGAGSQAYPIAAYDTNSQIVFYDWITFDVAPGTLSISGNNTNSSISNAVMRGITTPYPTAQILIPGDSANQFFTSMTAPAAQLTFTLALDGTFKPSSTVAAGGTNNYANWIAQYYTSSPADFPNSDPDGDSSTNLDEYFQGRNPSNADNPGAQTVSFTPNTNPATVLANFGTATYTFQKSSNAADTIQSLTWASSTNSSNKWDWKTTGLNFVRNDPGGAGYYFPVYQISPVTTSNVFFQLKPILP